MQEFHKDYNRKAIIAPKFLRMLWLKEEKLDDVREALEEIIPTKSLINCAIKL